MNNIKEMVIANRQEAINLLKANGGEIVFTNVDFSDEEEFFDLMEEEGDEFGDVINDCPIALLSMVDDSDEVCIVSVLDARIVDDTIEFTAFIKSDEFGMDITKCHLYECEYYSDNFIYEEIGKRLSK